MKKTVSESSLVFVGYLAILSVFLRAPLMLAQLSMTKLDLLSSINERNFKSWILAGNAVLVVYFYNFLRRVLKHVYKTPYADLGMLTLMATFVLAHGLSIAEDYLRVWLGALVNDLLILIWMAQGIAFFCGFALTAPLKEEVEGFEPLSLAMLMTASLMVFFYAAGEVALLFSDFFLGLVFLRTVSYMKNAAIRHNAMDRLQLQRLP